MITSTFLPTPRPLSPPFDPILGHPTDADHTRLYKELTKIFLPLPYNAEKGINNLVGLFMDEDDHKQHYHTKFPTPTNPAVYDETITNNATNVVQTKAEAVHTAKIANYLLFPPPNKTPVYLSSCSYKTCVSEKYVNPSGSTLPWNHLNSYTTCKLYEVAYCRNISGHT